MAARPGCGSAGRWVDRRRQCQRWRQIRLAIPISRGSTASVRGWQRAAGLRLIHSPYDRAPQGISGENDGQGGVSGSGRDGLSDGGASRRQGPRRDGLQQDLRQGRGLDQEAQGQGRQDAEGSRRPARRSCSAASATTSDLRAVVLGADGAFAGMAKGAIFFDNTTASADIARELHAAGKKKRHRLHRRAGVGRPGRRRERPAHRDVRRRAGAVRQGQAGGRRLRQGGHADRPAGLGPDHQDDEPDVHRRHRPGPGRGAATSASAPASTWTR